MTTTKLRSATLIILFIGLASAAPAAAHCDAVDGPVVTDAKLALETGEVTPVLKWVAEEDEAEIRSTFQSTLDVRALGDEARALADRHFFETVVRVHRASEGEPYTGLKPAGGPLPPGVAAADAALASGDVDALVNHLQETLADRVRSSFNEARTARQNEDASVEAGRHFVEAYVGFVHQVRGVAEALHGHHAH